MNTEAYRDKMKNKLTSIGERLRQSREKRGLSQKEVAERLCLKVSTVRDIETDQNNPNLVSTFLRGYIRSYARLVNLSEEEINKEKEKVDTACFTKSNSRTQNRKQRYKNWLMVFTGLIICMVIGITGITTAWLWQKYLNHLETNSTEYVSIDDAIAPDQSLSSAISESDLQ